MTELIFVNARTGSPVWDVDPVEVNDPMTDDDADLVLSILENLEQAYPTERFRAVSSSHVHTASGVPDDHTTVTQEGNGA